MKFAAYGSYFYFTLGVSLVTALTFVKLTCPVDSGTGVIAGAEGLKVKDIEYQIIDAEVFDTGCAEIYGDFSYSVNVTLVNETADTKLGALLVKFYNPSAVKGSLDLAAATQVRADELEISEVEVVLTEEISKGGLITTFTAPPVATKFIFVELPADTTRTIEETIDFRGFGYQEVSQFRTEGTTHVVSVAPPVNTIVCPYSHGTGKVTMTEWLRLKAGI